MRPVFLLYVILITTGLVLLITVGLLAR